MAKINNPKPNEPPQGSEKGKLKLTGKTFFTDQTDGFYGPKD